MIEIKETLTESLDRIAERAAKYEKIAPLAKAWAKVDADDCYTEQQKNMCCVATLHTILRIIKEGNHE